LERRRNHLRQIRSTWCRKLAIERPLPALHSLACARHALLLDPAERLTPGVAAQTLLPSTLKTVSASDPYSFRGSITRPSDPLCTLRSQGRPWTTQHSVPAGCQPLPGRLNPCRVPSEVLSRILLHMTSNSSRLGLAHFQQNRLRSFSRRIYLAESHRSTRGLVHAVTTARNKVNFAMIVPMGIERLVRASYAVRKSCPRKHDQMTPRRLDTCV
jgi:hypothetical protein